MIDAQYGVPPDEGGRNNQFTFVWVNTIKTARVCVRALSKRSPNGTHIFAHLALDAIEATLKSAGSQCLITRCINASKRSMRTRARDFACVRQPEQSVRGRKAISVYPYELDA